MGREVRRVAVDFRWPIHRIWEGFITPPELTFTCPHCEGTCTTPQGRALEKQWWQGNPPIRTSLTQDEVDMLVAEGRLMQFTHQPIPGRGYVRLEPVVRPLAQEFNRWSVASAGSLFAGLDSYDKTLVLQHRLEKMGGQYWCPHCKGKGILFPSPEAQQKYENWKQQQPSIGWGWQLWETVSEGSPVTPVFRTAEELAEYLAKEDVRKEGGDYQRLYQNWLKLVHAGWMPSMMLSSEGVATGADLADGINPKKEETAPDSGEPLAVAISGGDAAERYLLGWTVQESLQSKGFENVQLDLRKPELEEKLGESTWEVVVRRYPHLAKRTILITSQIPEDRLDVEAEPTNQETFNQASLKKVK